MVGQRVGQRMRSVSSVCRGTALAALFSGMVLLSATGARSQDPGADAAMQAAQQANQIATQAAQQASQQAMQDAQQASQQAMQAAQQAAANAGPTMPPQRPQWPSFPQADKPLFSLRPGKVAAGSTVTIRDDDPKAMILYTTDGTAPTMSSKVYAAPIVLGSSLRLRAIALSTTRRPSPVASAKYIVR